MSAVATNEAKDRLTQAIEGMGADDIAEVYYELFPDEPAILGDALKDLSPFVSQINFYIEEEIVVEEILDLWHVVFPQHRNVVYDEQTGGISYDEGAVEDE